MIMATSQCSGSGEFLLEGFYVAVVVPTPRLKLAARIGCERLTPKNKVSMSQIKGKEAEEQVH